MSNAPLVTNAKQTALTNMAAYLRNRRPERACGGVPPVPAPGWRANDVIRSIPRPGRERRAPILRCLTIACWAAPAPGRISSGSVLLDADERDKVRQMLLLEGTCMIIGRRDLSRDLNCAFLAANSLSIWQSPGGRDDN